MLYMLMCFVCMLNVVLNCSRTRIFVYSWLADAMYVLVVLVVQESKVHERVHSQLKHVCLFLSVRFERFCKYVSVQVVVGWRDHTCVQRMFGMLNIQYTTLTLKNTPKHHTSKTQSINAVDGFSE